MGIEVVDPNSHKPMASPNPNEKPDNGAGGRAMVVVELDAEEPRITPVVALEKKLRVDTTKEA